MRQTAIFFVLRLDTSEDALVQIFPTQRTEAVYEGHRRAFEFFGGVPHTILYDNATTLVAHVLRGRDRQETAAFLALRAHYGFAADFCQPGLKGAHEKGGVENGVGWARRALLVPVPEAESWDALNAELARRCRERRAKRHSREDGTVGEWVERERAHLLPLPAMPVACCQVTSARVNRYAMVTKPRRNMLDRSAPNRWPKKELTRRAIRLLTYRTGGATTCAPSHLFGHRCSAQTSRMIRRGLTKPVRESLLDVSNKKTTSGPPPRSGATIALLRAVGDDMLRRSMQCAMDIPQATPCSEGKRRMGENM